MNKIETDVSSMSPQQMVLGNVVFHPKVVEQPLRTGVLTHHGEQPSNNGDEAQDQQEL